MATPTQTFISGLSGLRAYWPLDDGDPTDELVGGLDLTLSGSPTTGIDMGFAAGDTGIAFASSSTQYATRAHDTAFDAGLGDWSVAFWAIIPSSDATTRYLVGHDGDGDAGSWDIKHVNSLLQSRFAGETPGNSSFTPNSSVKFIVYNFDRDGNATRYVDGSLNHSVSIASASAVDVTVNNAFYLARRASSGSPGYSDVTFAHVVLRTSLWTPQEMTGAMAARLADVETDAPAQAATGAVAAPGPKPGVGAPAGVATITGSATDGSFSFSAAMAGLAEMQVWATEGERSELDMAVSEIPLEITSHPATTAVANEPTPSVEVNAGLASMTLRVYTRSNPAAGDEPTLRIPVSGSIRFGEENLVIRFDGFMRFQDEEV